MSKRFSKKPLALAVGAAFGLTGMAAEAALFQVADLGAGYMVAQATPATPATPAKPATPAAPAEGKAGEAKCGAECVKKVKDSGKSEKDAKAHCDKMKAEGKCGGDKAGHEGKCGEGKCGGKK